MWVKPELLSKTNFIRMEKRCLLAIDYGQRVLGLAMSDQNWSTTMPYRVERADLKIHHVRNEILKICDKFEIGGIVVGWPVHVNDERLNYSCRRVAEFMEELNLHMFPKTLWDECYSTELAKQLVEDSYQNNPYNRNYYSRRKKLLNKKMKYIDALAAEQILKNFLYCHGENGTITQPDFDNINFQ